MAVTKEKPKILFYTSCIGHHFARAHVLRDSVRHFFPDIPFVLCCPEKLEQFPFLAGIFDNVISVLDIAPTPKAPWLFGRTADDMRQAMAGLAAVRLLERYKPRLLIYLDPDSRLFSYPDELMEYLEFHDIVLTPRLTRPSRDVQAELACLRGGTYDAGLIALRYSQTGVQFANWWADRLLQEPSGGQSDFSSGRRLFDPVPALFPGVRVMRETNYCVADWNLHERVLHRNGSEYFIDGRPLCLYRFVGSPEQDIKGLDDVRAESRRQLWAGYESEVQDRARPEYNQPWSLGFFSSGREITEAMQTRYRNDSSLRTQFPDPFDSSGIDSFETFWDAQVSGDLLAPPDE